METEQIKLRLDTFVEILNGLPGIEVTSHHFDGVTQIDGSYVAIFLHAHELEYGGLFFLTRTIDKRYSHGVWTITLSSGDLPYDNGDRPITYLLKNEYVFAFEVHEIGGHIEEVIENMHFLKSNNNFMKQYSLRTEDFENIQELKQYKKIWQRQNALDGIGI
jgi:hypothetical protein